MQAFHADGEKSSRAGGERRATTCNLCTGCHYLGGGCEWTLAARGSGYSSTRRDEWAIGDKLAKRAEKKGCEVIVLT